MLSRVASAAARARPTSLHCTASRRAHSLPPHTIFLPAGANEATPATALLPPGRTPVALLLGWVGGRERAMRKYASIFNERSIDVIALLLKPEHVYAPVAKGRGTMKHIADALSAPDTAGRPILIQGFSAGAYMYGNLLTELDARGDEGVAFTRRVRGFVFDSPVDIDGVPFGLSRAIFGNTSEGSLRQKLVQRALEVYLSPSLPMRPYYQASSDAMHGTTFASGITSPLAVPSSFL